MLIEDVVGVKIGLEKKVDMEDENRGWNLEDIAGDSLTRVICHVCCCLLQEPNPEKTMRGIVL
jgi:hypothetical protein